MEMDAGMTSHVVLLTRVGEEVWLCAGFDAGIEEGKTMLRHDGVVVVACDDLQFAFQVLRLVDKADLGIAFGICFRSSHIALAVHHLIPFPVNYWASSHTNLEHIGVVGHQRDGHKASERPAVNAQTLHIYIR